MQTVELIHFSNVVDYRERVLPLLMRNEAQNCLGLGIIGTLVSSPGTLGTAYLWALQDRMGVIGAAWMTPPHAIGLTAMSDDALEVLIEGAAHLVDRPRAVVGPKRESDLFAGRWIQRTGTSIESTMEQRIFQLRDVKVPVGVPGQMRLADQGDQALLADWCVGFIRDCGLSDEVSAGNDYAARAIAARSRYLWVAEGCPVAMAGTSGRTPSGIRISWVYTPNEWRGRGYASVLVAHLSQRMLSDGRKYCYLYTDLANPTSNHIYQKIGFQAVCDSAHHRFRVGSIGGVNA